MAIFAAHAERYRNALRGHRHVQLQRSLPVMGSTAEEAVMIAINNILVATDFGEAADSALRYGRELAGRFGATLHVLNVVENFYVTTFGAETYAAFVPDMQRELEGTAKNRLDEMLIDSDGSGPATKAVVMTSGS